VWCSVVWCGVVWCVVLCCIVLWRVVLVFASILKYMYARMNAR
jgi:hypothetical protein